METQNFDSAAAASEESAETGHAPVIARYAEAHLSNEYTAAQIEAPAVAPSGGDFQNAFAAADGSVAIVVGDVTGHGPEQTAQADHMRELLTDCLDNGLSPSETLTAVNAMIEPDPNFEGFGTVFVGTLEPETGTLTYASGGHEPALVADPAASGDEAVTELDGTGPPVGAFPPGLARFKEKQAVVPDGGTLLVYTDGVPDARSSADRRHTFGLERLKQVFARLAKLRPSKLVTAIFAKVVAFCRGRFHDDVAMMAIHRRLPNSAPAVETSEPAAKP